ncbi:MAG: hypothetical protein M0T74_06195 [Desulfitobacterium hafniense]|nr:hypothetical protein [Desulfitobacterium hafniense]
MDNANNEFSVKDINKMFSISPKKAEYYEKNSIITTMRNSKNNYRFFTLHNICEITRAKMYRALGISIKETSNIIKEADLKKIGDVFESRISKLEEQIKYQTLILEILKSRSNRIIEILDGQLNKFEIISRPPIHYSLINIKEYYPDKIVSKLGRWREAPAFSEACISYAHNKETDDYDISVGLCMDHHFYEEIINSKTPDDLVLEADHVLYTVMLVNEDDVFNPSIIEPILKYAESKGISLKSEIFCRTFLVLKGEKDHHNCYFEFFAQII